MTLLSQCEQVLQVLTFRREQSQYNMPNCNKRVILQSTMCVPQSEIWKYSPV